ncbi:glycine cleavage system aminomethyltransferase GcvT [Candidatus Halobonum tyrrellensis]|uniref:Probable aminomethyltransferase n=1 Tax=Candidatus Halobonum tyrrellensis G22 TaxID=1324957 RepID=V4GRD7_9EURY|nr:glycine cleavage system aminomethyltransferase GcvT [Candidatus Halobonum tyrrellensis]ESP87621.1 glycine cleavage system aminomethyltransferase T [Candidatus Halobonum tyrrellensis G22]
MALRKPPLREVHADRGAKFTEFGGWDMPVEFDSIRAEHEAVRGAAGVFDVSHMGEIAVVGPDATALTQRLTTNDVTRLDPGESQYSALTREDGVMLDDTVVYRLPADRPAGVIGGERSVGAPGGSDAGGASDAPADDAYLFVPNAGHDEGTHERWVAHRDEWDLDAEVRNVTDDWAMFAIQGPDAPGLVDAAADGDVLGLDRFAASFLDVAGVECWVARTGYTGEDGFELLCPWGDAETVWAAFADDCQPCGLGARDTLRIEEGFLLSGQDFHPDEEPHTPYEADIGFVVALDTEFVGRDALADQDAAGVDERFVGLELLDRGVPRHGYDVTDHDGHVVGSVTSGTMSPSLDKPIALGYLPTDLTDPGTHVSVVVRGQDKRAKVVQPPFN